MVTSTVVWGTVDLMTWVDQVAKMATWWLTGREHTDCGYAVPSDDSHAMRDKVGWGEISPYQSEQCIILSLCMLCEVTQSCLTLCDPMDYSVPGSSVHGTFQARVLEWVAISFSSRSSRPRDQPGSPAL